MMTTNMHTAFSLCRWPLMVTLGRTTSTFIEAQMNRLYDVIMSRSNYKFPSFLIWPSAFYIGFWRTIVIMGFLISLGGISRPLENNVLWIIITAMIIISKHMIVSSYHIKSYNHIGCQWNVAAKYWLQLLLVLCSYSCKAETKCNVHSAYTVFVFVFGFVFVCKSNSCNIL